MRIACSLVFILSVTLAHSQVGVSTPLFHVDTLLFSWTGPVKKKQREGEWKGEGKIFKDKATVNYMKGERQGKWMVYYDNGKLEEQGNFVNDERDGLWIKYDNLGDTFFLCNYSLGVLHGLYKTYSNRNGVTRQGNFVNGKKEGEWIANSYTAQHQLLSHDIYNYVHDTLNGKSELQTFYSRKTSWYESGVLIREENVSVQDSVFAQQKKADPEKVAFSFVEEMPTFPGGEPAYQKYLNDNIRYPTSAFDAHKEGTAYVKFTVEKDGAISEVTLQKGIKDAPELDTEALRVIAAMPPWTPGKMNGKAVRVTQTVPVKFVLD